jgi:hypothetical protein
MDAQRPQESGTKQAVKEEAYHMSDLELLGHEPQFYAVARFNRNDDLVARTLMDPGATINVMCPSMANRAAIRRKQLSVDIFHRASVNKPVWRKWFCAVLS